MNKERFDHRSDLLASDTLPTWSDRGDEVKPAATFRVRVRPKIEPPIRAPERKVVQSSPPARRVAGSDSDVRWRPERRSRWAAVLSGGLTVALGVAAGCVLAWPLLLRIQHLAEAPETVSPVRYEVLAGGGKAAGAESAAVYTSVADAQLQKDQNVGGSDVIKPPSSGRSEAPTDAAKAGPNVTSSDVTKPSPSGRSEAPPDVEKAGPNVVSPAVNKPPPPAPPEAPPVVAKAAPHVTSSDGTGEGSQGNEAPQPSSDLVREATASSAGSGAVLQPDIVNPRVTANKQRDGGETARRSSAQGDATARPVPETAGEIPRSAVERFVTQFYLAGADLTQEQINTLYAPTVAYFGTPAASRSDIARQQRSYYRRWPERNYRLVDGTLSVSRRSDRLMDIAFDYDFDVRSQDRRSAGRGHTSLTLDWSTPEGRIVREEGSVTRRVRSELAKERN